MSHTIGKLLAPDKLVEAPLTHTSLKVLSLEAHEGQARECHDARIPCLVLPQRPLTKARAYVEARKQFETRQKQMKVWNALSRNPELIVSALAHTST